MTAWVLDVDDTLYLEREYVRSGFAAVGRAAAERWGLPGLADLLWAGFLRGVRGDSFDVALRAAGRAPTAGDIEWLVSVYRTHPPEIRLLPDAARFLARASIAGVITDGPLDSQQRKVRALGLEGRGLVICTASLGPAAAKPSPEAYLAIQAATGLAGLALGYVADNPLKDFVAPRALGWRAVRVRRPGSLHAERPTPDGVDEVTSLDEVAG